MTYEQNSQIVNGAAVEYDAISRDEIQRHLRDHSIVVVDVLPRVAYEGGHIPGAINLPLAELSSHASEAIPDSNAEIVVYCASFT